MSANVRKLEQRVRKDIDSIFSDGKDTERQIRNLKCQMRDIVVTSDIL